MTGARFLPAVLVLTGLLAACSSGRHSLDTINIVARGDANHNSAVAVDVVLVRESGLGHQLAKLTASDWFQRRRQLLRDHPDSLKVMSWELIPGQSVASEPDAKVSDAFVFADYPGPGDHRLRLSAGQEDVSIFLEAGDVAVAGSPSAP